MERKLKIILLVIATGLVLFIDAYSRPSFYKYVWDKPIELGIIIIFIIGAAIMWHKFGVDKIIKK